ncbi:MAG: hypothetical protein V4538_17125 [Bacteroidota bacterium]
MSTLPLQTINLSVANPSATANFSIPLYQGAGYRADFNTWSLLENGGFIQFNLSLPTAIPVALTLSVCAALVNGSANNPISITVNGQAFVNSYSDHQADFHNVSWVIPANLLVAGNNNITVTLDQSATTQLFINAATVDQAVLTTQTIDLSIPNPSATANFSIPLYQGAGYRSDYRTWSLLVNNGFIRFQVDLSSAVDVNFSMDLAAALVNGVANSPTAVTVNGKSFWSLSPTSGGFSEFSNTIPAKLLTAGANIIEVTLANNATGQLFINSATVTGG